MYDKTVTGLGKVGILTMRYRFLLTIMTKEKASLTCFSAPHD